MPCHPECQQRLINSKGDAVCNVCRSQYTNVVCRKTHRPCQTIDMIGGVVIALSFCGFVSLTWLYLFYPTEHYLFIEAMFLFATGLVMLKQTLRHSQHTIDVWRVHGDATRGRVV